LTALRLRFVRGTLDENTSTAPHTTKHLDRISTRTRLVRPPERPRLARPRVGVLGPLTSPAPGQKSEHLIRLPTTTYRYGRDQDRRGSNTGVSPHCFTAHPVMGGETCHYTHLTVHCLPSVTLEGGYDKARIPQSQGFDLIHPTLTLPRPSLDA
jgi:hypothetical protein